MDITEEVASVSIEGDAAKSAADEQIANLEKLIAEKSQHRLYRASDGADITEQAMKPYHDALAAMRAARDRAT